MQIHIVTLLVSKLSERPVSVVVPGVQNGVIRQIGQLLQAVVHVLGTAARQIDAPTGIDEKRISRNQPIFDQETLRAWSVPGSMDKGDRQVTDVRGIATIDLDKIGCRQPS